MLSFRPLLIGLAGLGFISCSSITQGTSQDIFISTSPGGASCSLEREGVEIAKVANTPGTVNVDKTKHDITIICNKDGYEAARYLNESGWESASGGAGIALDVFLTLGVSSAVDSATGADNKYEESVYITLAPKLVDDSDSTASDNYRSVSGSQVSAADTSRFEARAVTPTTDGIWILEIGEVTAMDDRDRVRVSVENGRFSAPYETNGWRGQIQGEMNEFGTLTATGSASKMAWGSNNLTMKFTSTYSSGGYQEEVLARGRVNATFKVSLKRDMAEVTRATD